MGKYDVGEYWHRDAQIDVVGLRADGWVDLGECKWHGRPSVAAVRQELAARVALYPAGRRTVQLRAFLRTKTKAPADGIQVHDLAALYGS